MKKNQKIIGIKKFKQSKYCWSNDENISKYESRPKSYTKKRFEKYISKCRTSLLDDSSPDSYVNNSAFKGLI